MLTTGAMVTAADYVQMQRVRRVALRAMTGMFERFDVIINPTAIIPAPSGDHLTYERLGGTIMTPYWNALGYPAMSIPMGLTSAGLPAGLQLAGRPFDEATVFRAADAYQQVTTHHLAEAPTVLELLP